MTRTEDASRQLWKERALAAEYALSMSLRTARESPLWSCVASALLSALATALLFGFFR